MNPIPNIKTLVSLAFLVLLSTSFSLYAEVKPLSPQQVLDSYFNAILQGEYKTAYLYISTADQKNKSLPSYLKENQKDNSPLDRVLSDRTSYKILRVDQTGQTAIATVEHSHPNFESAVPDILSALFTSVLGDRDEKKLEEVLAKKFENGLPIQTEQKTYTLQQEADGWKIVMGWKSPQQRRIQRDSQLITENRVKWESEIEIDEMTDEKIATLSSPTIRVKGQANTPYRFQIQCQSQSVKLSMALDWGKNTTLGSANKIQFRFDRDKLFEVAIQTDAQNKTSRVTEGAAMDKIIALMEKKQIMRIKHPDSQVARFSLKGFAGKFTEACKP